MRVSVVKVFTRVRELREVNGSLKDMTKVNYDKNPWTNNPTEQISYVSCHDDMCLVDRLKVRLDHLLSRVKPKEQEAENGRKA